MADPLLPENDPKSPAQKPGWRTSEFWLTLATSVVGGLLAAGVWPDDSQIMKVLGVGAVLLSNLGYQVQRGYVKSSGNKAAGIAVHQEGK